MEYKIIKKLLNLDYLYDNIYVINIIGGIRMYKKLGVNRKSGISLILLIITIVVILILAAGIILTLSKMNPIGEANSANIKSSNSK